jgi:arabinofuranosyltransferase
LIDSGGWSAGRLIILSAMLGTSVLTRLDSLLLVAIVTPVSLFFSLRGNINTAQKLKRTLCLTLPFATLVGSWLIWKYLYYSDILPNTYYLKVASETSIKRGLMYTYLFLNSYWLIPFTLLLLTSARWFFDRPSRELLVLATVVITWVLYTVKVGGDFMEFRFLVPVLPFFFIPLPPQSQTAPRRRRQRCLCRTAPCAQKSP